MQSFLEIISVFLLSAVFLVKGGVTSALALSFPFFKSLTITTLGGITGSLLFIFISDKVIAFLKKRRLSKKHSGKTKKKNFTFQNKFLVKIKKRFGLLGIAVATPITSYPLGCYIAVRYYPKEKQRIFIYMLVSTLTWSFVAFSYKLFF
jgi:Sec-independent protein secretion pathway component TatC